MRVNEVMLGFVDTRHGPGTRGWGLLSDAERQAIRDHTPARPHRDPRRRGEGRDVRPARRPVHDRCGPAASTAATCCGGERVPEMPEGVEKTEVKGSRGQGVREKLKAPRLSFTRRGPARRLRGGVPFPTEPRPLDTSTLSHPRG
ncbi:MAG: hypothetical protein MZV70_06930 [Desulfobacterales bacterium]|nr:hypothetical protein [Desulfobacterales bacterium]